MQPTTPVRISPFIENNANRKADSAASSLIWMNIEYHLGLISGSVSSVRPLFTRKALFSSKNTPVDSLSKTQFSGKGYELSDSNGWKLRKIMKTQEVHVIEESSSSNDSKERIVPGSLR